MGVYYWDVVLPGIRQLADDVFVFQQTTHLFIVLLTRSSYCAARHWSAFIPLDLWPVNSPDLNPVDDSIWECVLYCSTHPPPVQRVALRAGL